MRYEQINGKNAEYDMKEKRINSIDLYIYSYRQKTSIKSVFDVYCIFSVSI